MSTLSPGPSDSRLALAWLLGLLIVLLLLMAGPRLHAQSERPPELTPLIERLLRAELLLRELEPALLTRAESLAALESRLATLSESLTAGGIELELLRRRLLDSEALRLKLEAALSEMQTWLDELTQRYERLLSSWASYRQEMQAQVGQLQRGRDAWRAAAIAGWIAALIAAVCAIAK